MKVEKGERRLIMDLLRLTYVPRWGIMPMRRPQSVAEHSFRVAAIAADLSRTWGPEEGPGMLAVLCAIVHDIDEAVTGDIPGNLKRRYPAFKTMLYMMAKNDRGGFVIEEPPPNAAAVVKIADVIETITYLQTWGLSNARASSVIQELFNHMVTLKDTVPPQVWARAEALLPIILEEVDDGEGINDGGQGHKGGPRKRKVPGGKNQKGRVLRIVPAAAPVHPSPGGGEGEGA